MAHAFKELIIEVQKSELNRVEYLICYSFRNRPIRFTHIDLPANCYLHEKFRMFMFFDVEKQLRTDRGFLHRAKITMEEIKYLNAEKL